MLVKNKCSPCAQAFWGLSGLLTVPVVLRLTGSDDPVPATHVDVVSGTAAVCGVIAELFILKAILAYEAECQQAGRALRKLRSGSGTRTATPCKGSGGGGSPGASPATTVPRTRSSSNAATLRKSLLRADGGVANSTASASAKATVVATAGDNDTTAGAAETRRMGEEETEDDGSCSDLDAEEEEDEGGGADDNAMPPALFSPRAASAAVIVMGLTLAATGFFLLMAVEYMPDLPSRLLYCCLSLTCLVIGASCTHGLGGHLAYAKNARGGKSAWSFFQPFAGGTAFVATQAVGWSLFACTLVYLVVFLQLLVRGLAYCVRCWALGAGVMMFATQLCLGVSLLTWRGTVSAKKLVQLSKGGASLAGTLLPVLMLYLPVHAFFGVWAASFALLPFRWATAAWLSFAVPYVAFTFAGAPQETGWRTWPSLQAWVSSNLEASLTFFFGHVEVLKDGAEPLDPAHKYIFGAWW